MVDGSGTGVRVREALPLVLACHGRRRAGCPVLRAGCGPNEASRLPLPCRYRSFPLPRKSPRSDPSACPEVGIRHAAAVLAIADDLPRIVDALRAEERNAGRGNTGHCAIAVKKNIRSRWCRWRSTTCPRRSARRDTDGSPGACPGRSDCRPPPRAFPQPLPAERREHRYPPLFYWYELHSAPKLKTWLHQVRAPASKPQQR